MKEIEFIPVESNGKYSIEPIPAVKKVPNWFKSIPPLRKFAGYEKEEFTIKKCIPVLDALTMGYYLVTKYDLHWKINDQGEHVCEFDQKLVEGGDKPISMHPFDQIKNIELSEIYNEYAYKFSSPYLIKTPPGYSCIFTHPFNQISPFYTLTGIVDTDMHPLAVQFPFLMVKGFEGKIAAGTPIVQIIPFQREEWRMYNVSPDRRDKRDNDISMDEFMSNRYDMESGLPVVGPYKKKYRIKKKYL